MERELTRDNIFKNSQGPSNHQQYQVPRPSSFQQPLRFPVLRPLNFQRPPFPVTRNFPNHLSLPAPQMLMNTNINMHHPPAFRSITKNTIPAGTANMSECSTSDKESWPMKQPQVLPSASHDQAGKSTGAIKKIPKKGLSQMQVSEVSAISEQSQSADHTTYYSESDTLAQERSEIFDIRTLTESQVMEDPQSYEESDSASGIRQRQNEHEILAEDVEEIEKQTVRRRICLIPKYFDSFVLQEMIGCGSFANVYKATDKNTSSEVAIKAYRFQKRSFNYFARIANEVAFLKTLSHPHIIKYVGSSIKTKFAYVALEYSEHGCLTKLMTPKAGLPEELVQTVIKQVLSAMYYLQTLCIVHGDIKPDNIIIVKTKPTLIIKLTDFGLSEVSLKNELFRERAGSFLYMAPELHLGFPSDYKSDLFSAGVVMFEMLYGRKPFIARIPTEQYIKNFRKREEFVLPEAGTSAFTPNCIDLVKNLLSYDKHERLSGMPLLQHPFLQLDPINDERDHYLEGYKCFLKGATCAVTHRFGQAYTEITAAILHLRIHSNRVSDIGLFKYLCMKIGKYKRYCHLLEERLLVMCTIEPMEVLVVTEKLRCLLQPAPLLLAAFDSCAIGEMYYWMKRTELAEDKLRRGCDILTANMRYERAGLRKDLLCEKLNQWLRMLQKIHMKHFGTPGVFTIRGM